MAQYVSFSLDATVNLPFVDRIHPQSNKFATRVENEDTSDSKLNDSPAIHFACFLFLGFIECNVIYHLLTESEVITGKSQTEAFHVLTE